VTVSIGMNTERQSWCRFLESSQFTIFEPSPRSQAFGLFDSRLLPSSGISATSTAAMILLSASMMYAVSTAAASICRPRQRHSITGVNGCRRSLIPELAPLIRTGSLIPGLSWRIRPPEAAVIWRYFECKIMWAGIPRMAFPARKHVMREAVAAMAQAPPK
jgi:hypothetical protein